MTIRIFKEWLVKYFFVHKIVLKPFLYFNILSIIRQLLLSVKWRHLFSCEVITRPIYGMETNIKSGNFMVLSIYQIILHLNKITKCLKMTTFKIVFTIDVFYSAETTMHCKVTCILYKKQAHFSQLFCLQVRSVTP